MITLKITNKRHTYLINDAQANLLVLHCNWMVRSGYDNTITISTRLSTKKILKLIEGVK